MKATEPDPRTIQRARTIQLAGFLRGLSATDQHTFSEQERDNLRESAAILAKSIGRPDVAPAESEGGEP